MEVEVPKGKYVLAVSGGVDSMTLLHLLAQKCQSPVNSRQSTAEAYRLTTIDSTSSLELVVAHFNHGIRADAAQDEKLVRQTAGRLGLEFEAGYGNLESNASEEAARAARYEFLDELKNKYKARAIITAHHQDDLIETALLNLLRGTGINGLVAISANRQVLRPMLKLTKAEILVYAQKNGVVWREDTTNTNSKYLRNRLRNQILRDLTNEQRNKILENIEKVAKLHAPIKSEIANLSQLTLKDNQIDRAAFSLLPTEVGRELVAYWLRARHTQDYDRKTVSRIDMAIRTFPGGSLCPVKKDLKLAINKKTAKFIASV